VPAVREGAGAAPLLIAGAERDDPLQDMIFRDRKDAGRQLAAKLLSYRSKDPVVLALPRGGVPVGFEVAAALHAPLDVIVVRKLGAPGQPELGIGAVVDGDHPQSVLNEDVMEMLHVSPAYLQRATRREVEEIRRRQERYRRGRPATAIAGKTAIVVDDGIATGASTRAALRGVRRARPDQLVLAVPVAPPETVAALRAEVDDLICLNTPSYFAAVGQFYDDFGQISDEEVVHLLDEASRRWTGTSAPVTSGS
jgi:putative phosphoribosyl transferase